MRNNGKARRAFAFLLLALDATAGAFATDYSSDVRKNDNRWLNLNLYQMWHTANPFGPPYNNMYFEVEGGARSGVLDLYYFFDVNEVLGWGTYSRNAGDFFTKIKPRLSIDGIIKRDLAVGPVKEWYIATQYKGFNGGEYYSAGIGTDLAIPYVDMFHLNFWPKYVRTSGDDEMNYSGLEISLDWYTVLCKMPWDSNLSYQGWLDYGFNNSYARSNGNGQTSDEFQMFNGFFWNKGHYSLSFDVKFHRHLTYRDTGNASDTTWFLGAHYHM
ncbi:MAG: outer membrane protein OmpK [Elusimicrobiaceae bacterium]